IEEGMQPVQAAFRGVREVGFAVVAMTLTLAAVYAPVAFTTGRTGRLFIEFALTLAGAVLVSGFLALTLTPMLCSRMLRHDPNPGRLLRTIDRALAALAAGYERALRATLRVRWLVVLLGVMVAGASIWLFQTTKRELAPIEDRGTIVALFNGPDGASIDYTDRYARRIEAAALSIREADRVFVVSGSPTVTQGISFIRVVDWAERDRKVPEILDEFQPMLREIPGVQAFAVAPASLGQSPRERPINVVVLSSDPYEEIERTLEPMMQALRDDPRFRSEEH